MVTSIDETLVRKSGEEDEFSASFISGRGIGLGLCKSEASIREFGGIPEGMAFRITTNGDRAQIWVRPAELQAYRRGEQKTEDRRSMRRFGQSLPIMILLSIVISLISGGSLALRVYVAESIFSWEVNILHAFLWGAGVPASICALCLIYFALNKGRVK